MLIRSPGYMAELDAHLKVEGELTKIENELREKAEARQLIGKEAILYFSRMLQLVPTQVVKIPAG
ncbi:unnamed protein product [Debaryomyces tyrocola]|nr:unnamed protein product [Debaryomyces tyrocola]